MKRHRFSLFLLLSFVVSSFAIPDEAIDFNAYDVTGTTHNLFTYLTNGKYVLLDFTRKDG